MKILMGIVDGHTLVREGFRAVILSEDDMEIDFECDSFKKAQAYLNGSPEINMFIVDMSMHGHEGLKLIHLANSKDIKTIVVNLPAKGPFISDTKRAGADGYISQGASIPELLAGIRAVHNEQTYCSKDIKKQFENTMEENPFSSLTIREMHICRHIIDGVKIKKIAGILDISPKTVYVHKANAYRKLRINSTQSLFKLARENGVEGY